MVDVAKYVACTPVVSYLDASVLTVCILFCRHRTVQRAGLKSLCQAARARQLVTCRY